jgi:hypothetical protein
MYSFKFNNFSGNLSRLLNICTSILSFLTQFCSVFSHSRFYRPVSAMRLGGGGFPLSEAFMKDEVSWRESTRGYCNFSSTHVEQGRCWWCLVAFPSVGTFFWTVMHLGFTTGLQATNRKHQCTLLLRVFPRDIFVNRDVFETWERNWKKVG